jgi:tripartite-type tricarboxylate transporter receptor subunit TctC
MSRLGATCTSAIALAALASVTSAQPVAADAISDFYKGKTVTVTCPTPAGASFDLYTRLLSDHIGKHIPGKPSTIVQYRGGAGGAISAGYMHNVAPKDGTEIAIVLSPTVLTPILRPDVKWDSSKWQWLGSMTPRPSVVSVWHTAPAKTLAEAKVKENIMGATNKNGEPYWLPAIMNAFLGTKFKIVQGYQGGADMNLAMEKGETHGRMNYWSGFTSVKADWIQDKKIIQFVQYGPRIKELSDVPSLRDLVKPGIERQIVEFVETAEIVGIGAYAPPGVSADRVAALRQAFDAALRDPALLADAEKRKLEIEPVSGKAIQDVVEKAAATPKPVLDKFRQVLGL